MLYAEMPGAAGKGFVCGYEHEAIGESDSEMKGVEYAKRGAETRDPVSGLAVVCRLDGNKAVSRLAKMQSEFG